MRIFSELETSIHISKLTGALVVNPSTVHLEQVGTEKKPFISLFEYDLLVRLATNSLRILYIATHNDDMVSEGRQELAEILRFQANSRH